MKKVLLGLILGLLFGFVAAVFGEDLIPEKYAINLTYGCIQQVKTGNVLMPEALFYSPKEKPSSDNPKNIPRNYPHYLFSQSLNVKNYEILHAFLSHEFRKLSQQECNDLVTLKIQGDMDHFSQYFPYSRKVSKENGLQ